MNYPQTVDELLKWDTYTDKDSFGTFTIITGFEGTGRCFWCGKEIQGRRRFCKKGSGCWTRYQEHFAWGYAKAECLKRFDYKCANCGIDGVNMYVGDDVTNLRAHHIVPLKGEARAVSVYNIFWNLICLCHNCHTELHKVMRPPKQLDIDLWELARLKGQAVMGFSL